LFFFFKRTSDKNGEKYLLSIKNLQIKVDII
jgi:hypothetical protein